MLKDFDIKPALAAIKKSQANDPVEWVRQVIFIKINNIYGNLPPKNIAELKPWDSVNVDLIGPYSKSIRKHNLVGNIIKNTVCIT